MSTRLLQVRARHLCCTLLSKRLCQLERAEGLCSAQHAGFAGADYDLQDALVESTDKKTTTRNADGQQFYDYELIGPVRHFMPLSTASAFWIAEDVEEMATYTIVLPCRPIITLPQ